MKPPRKLRVAVLFGGRSAEHEVSCVSARHIVAAMDPDRYEVIPVGISRDGRWLLPDASRKVLDGAPLEIPVDSFVVEGDPVTIAQDPSGTGLVELGPGSGGSTVGDIDVVFPVLHGPFGEDGSAQGLLEMADIAYVGSGVLGSAMSMDKHIMKSMFALAQIPTPAHIVVREHEYRSSPEEVLDRAKTLGPAVFTKPANLGSSIGISRCTDADGLIAGLAEAFRYDRKVLVEEAVDGRELECGVLGNESPEASVVGEISASRQFYDYVAKYHDGSSKTLIPAQIPGEVSEQVRGLALKAFQAVEAAGMARVDFFYEPGSGRVLVNEVNTIPGFTTISMYPKLWEASGVPYRALIDRLIELALERHRSRPRGEEIPPPL